MVGADLIDGAAIAPAVRGSDAAWDHNVRGRLRVSRADLADCMLTLAVDPDAAQHLVSVAS